MKFIKQVKLVCITTALGTASAVGTDEQQRPLLQGHGGHRDRLVDSEALQDLIKPEILQARAEKLYDIARLGEPEYGHPTRVIGSAGELSLGNSNSLMRSHLTTSQAMSGPWTTSILQSLRSAATTRCGTSHFRLSREMSSSPISYSAMQYSSRRPPWA